MFSFRTNLALVIAAVLFAPPAFAASVRHSSTSTHSSASHRLSHSRRGSHRVRGQQAIEPDRVTEIQQALVREHYLSGDPNGDWDSTTVAAMQKYQADHGWQTKLMPDPRALKNLGLGPDYSTALNANGSSFAAPPSTSTSATQTAGFIAASGVRQ
jgi:peptidoglycan hydrolase-like protein with peptidoglycan-binding domain